MNKKNYSPIGFIQSKAGRRILIVLLNFIFTIVGGCSKLVSPLAWQATPITVDGKLTDWHLPLPSYDMKTKLNYSITNDADNLYVCIKASEDETQMKILRGGMFLWIDTAGKKNHLAGIEFPIQQLAQRTHERGGTTSAEANPQTDPSSTRHRLIAQQKQMQLTGFKNAENGLSPLNNVGGIQVALAWDSTGVLIYEARIPFKTFYRDKVSATDIIKTPWSIGILLNGIVMQGGNHSGGGSGSHGGGMGGGGGMHSGGIGGGGMRGGGGGMHGGGGSAGGDNSTLGENQSIWEYIKPVIKP